ncbi:MAG: TRAP transporter small permease [Alphaproteobacteria bacterium]
MTTNDPAENSAVLRILDRVLVWVSLLLGGAALGGMTVLSVWNVLIMRKALNNPIKGAEDVLVLMLVSIVALAIPLGARTGAHIEIEVLETRMSRAFARWSHLLVKVLSLVLLVVMTWRLWHAGQGAVRFGETTQQLMISYEPFYYLLALSTALYATVVAIEIVQILRGKKTAHLNMGSDVL